MDANSPKDDFGYWIDTNPEEVFSSNRDGGQGYDDIYKFLETKNFFVNKLSGKVTHNHKFL
jgi:hypothetical protein